MSYKRIEVEIDIDDLKEEIREEALEEMTTEEIIDELKDRGKWPEDIVSEESYESRFFMIPKLYFTPDDLYRHLCDICDCGYYEPKESLLNKLKDLM